MTEPSDSPIAPAPGGAEHAAPLPAEYQANILSALEAAGVAVPGVSPAAIRTRRRPTLRIWGLIILVVGLAALLVRGYIQHRQHAGPLTIWQVIWLTIPIVAAAAFIVYQVAAGRGFRLGHLLGLVVGTAGTSYLTAISSGQFVSRSLFQFDPSCMLQNTCAKTLSTANPASYVLKVVNNYWHVYGGAGFISAAVVGAVIGLGLGLLGRRQSGLTR